MGTKINPGKFDCYANALPDEPMFVLLARDPLAPTVVRAWASDYMMRADAKGAKMHEALDCAAAMETWREANPKPAGGYPASDLATIADYEEVLADHRRVVHELDVALNGDGAAEQASLIDILAQVKDRRERLVRWRHTNHPPAVGGTYLIGGYVSGPPRMFYRTFGMFRVTLDGPEWSYQDAERDRHIPIQYWCEAGPPHPESGR